MTDIRLCAFGLGLAGSGAVWAAFSGELFGVLNMATSAIVFLALGIRAVWRRETQP